MSKWYHIAFFHCMVLDQLYSPFFCQAIVADSTVPRIWYHIVLLHIWNVSHALMLNIPRKCSHSTLFIFICCQVENITVLGCTRMNKKKQNWQKKIKQLTRVIKRMDRGKGEDKDKAPAVFCILCTVSLKNNGRSHQILLCFKALIFTLFSASWVVNNPDLDLLVWQKKAKVRNMR